MREKVIKMVRQNLVIVIPSIFIVTVILGFMAFGFSDPTTQQVTEVLSITQNQVEYESIILNQYGKEDYVDSNPYFVLDPYKVSPLTGLIMFESDTAKQYRIVVNGKTDEGDIEFISESATSHFIPVYGLYPNYNNQIDIYEYHDQTQDTFIRSIFIQTDPLPEQVVVPTMIDTTYEYFGDDLMVLSPALRNYPVGVDFNGDVRWYLSGFFQWSFNVLDNGHFYIGSDRLMSDPYYVTSVYEMDYLGKIYTEYKIPGGYHHDLEVLPNGNLLVLTDDFQGTVEDKIIEVDKSTGEILDTWDLEELLPIFDGMAAMWTTTDWFHNNSVSYDAVNDAIVLSGRHQDAVVSIGRTSHELNWIIGDPDNWGTDVVNQYFFTPTGENFEWQYAQHSAMVLDNGNIFIFDNGNNKSKDSKTYVMPQKSYSRGVIYDIDETNMTIEQVYQFGKELGSDFYSPYISNVNYYTDGNYMIHSGGHGTVEGVPLNIPGPLYEDMSKVVFKSMTYEVMDGEIKYYLEMASNFYQAKRINLYEYQTNIQFGTANVFGELAETPQTDETYELSFSLLDTVPPKYEVEMVKESDRLVFDMMLDRNDVIYLVFQEVTSDQKITYKIPTSRTAYTAMCSATFQGDERQITYYINETNLTGSYDIYLVINGREYNTYYHVDFD